MNKDFRVSWVTNFPAPYRLGIWNRYSENFNLKVYFLSSPRNWRGWILNLEKERTWTHEFLSYFLIRIKEIEIFPSSKKWRSILKYSDCIILQGWEAVLYVRLARGARKYRKPLIIFYESTSKSHRFNNKIVNMVRASILDLADFIVTSGGDSTNAVLSMGISSSKVVTLFNPVDVEWFNSQASQISPTMSVGHHFLYVGQLIERKNVAALVRAFSEMREPNDTLSIVGEGHMGADLKQLVKELDLQHSIRFLGLRNQNELVAIYSESNTLILPSETEVWGLVVNEALACGLHVVVSENCGVANFVQKMKGTYIAGTESSSIAIAMQQSRNDWKGRIQNPEIMAYTPEQFANKIIELLD